jgi:anti-sigma B factor antagonist
MNRFWMSRLWSSPMKLSNLPTRATSWFALFQHRTCDAKTTATVANNAVADAAGPASPDLGLSQRQRSRAIPTIGIAEAAPGVVVVSVAGEAGCDNLYPLEFALTRLLARRAVLAVLDFTALTLLSSLAMGMLVGLRRDLGRWQGRVKLACVPPPILVALQTARLTDLFEVHATVEEALATAGTPSLPRTRANNRSPQ